MDNKDSITEIDIYGETIIEFPPDEWGRIGLVHIALIENAVMIVKNWNQVPVSTVNFTKNSEVTAVEDGHNSRMRWHAPDVISSTL